MTQELAGRGRVGEPLGGCDSYCPGDRAGDRFPGRGSEAGPEPFGRSLSWGLCCGPSIPAS